MSAAEEAALDALAAALAPRVARLLEMRDDPSDADTEELLARAGFEVVKDKDGASLDRPITRSKVAKPARKGRAA